MPHSRSSTATAVPEDAVAVVVAPTSRGVDWSSLLSTLTSNEARPYLLIALLLVAIYFRVAAKLVFDWYDLPDYSHGFLVPFFALFVLWDNRKVLRECRRCRRCADFARSGLEFAP